MARKPAAVERKINNLIHRYKWEFLRRNPEYRKDYKNFMREFGAWFRKNGYWYDRRKYDTRAWQFFEETIAPRLKELCVRWQISDPFSPDWSFDKAGDHYIYDFKVPIPTDCPDAKAGAVWDLPRRSANPARRLKKLVERMKARRARAKRLSRNKHDFVLRMDLRRPLALLLREANFWIRKRKQAHDALHSTTGRTVRCRLDCYSDYLKVWDLRAQKRTFAEIGKIVFPGEGAATQRAFDNFRRAKALVEGGYKKL